MKSPPPSRRWMLKSLAATGLFPWISPPLQARTIKRVKIVVIGGGFGGATAARFAKRLLPQAHVTLVEPQPSYVACPFSNLVIAGLRPISAQTFGYAALRREGIEVIPSRARDVDPAARKVTLAEHAGTQQKIHYDKLIVAAGIDFRWQAIPGYNESATPVMPHAWRAGEQTLALRQQLQAMPENGLAVIAIPAAPFRCPPGPYERASLVASFLKQHKPKAKLLLLDSNEQFSKQGLFLQAWQTHYGNLIEWRSPAEDGLLRTVDPARMTLNTDFESIQADVANVIPPQQAARICTRAGLTDASGWCPVQPLDFSSSQVPDIHVLGDATIAAPMPKSAFSANAQAKLAALQIARNLLDEPLLPTTLANTCYSFTTPNTAISVSGVYTNDEQKLASISGAGGTSPMDAAEEFQRRESNQARAWFQAITTEAFA
ncbi:MAG: NAD(P)/FAD-dependent oxidoreductase [Pseudomonadota bacterium]